MYRIAAFAFGCLTLASSSWAVILPTGPNCPSVYQPTECSQGDITVSGTNRCFAYAELQKALSMHGIPLDPEAVKCYRSDLAARPRPTCGIVPTLSSCQVTVDGRTFFTRAHDCDSPVPELIQHLQAAGITDTSGLVAECTREQLGDVTTYSVNL